MSYLSTSPAGGSGSGTVTQINTGTGVTGGPITATGTIALSTPLQPIATLTGNALKVLRVNAGETAVEYAAIGTGDVVGPGSAIDGQIAVFDSTTGKLIKVFAPTAGSILFAGINGIAQQDNANLFYDDTNNRVIVGATSTDYAAIAKSVNTVQTGAAYTVNAGYGASSGGAFLGLRANGTPGTPTAVASGNILNTFSGAGYDGTAWITATRGGLRVISTEAWSSTAHGTQIVFSTTPNGTTTLTDVFRINHNGTSGFLDSSTHAVLNIGSTRSAAFPASGGTNFTMYDGTFTDTSSSGTVASMRATVFGTPTYAATSATTYTSASTVYIAASPVASTNVSITQGYALFVASGITRLGGSTWFGATASPVANDGAALGSGSAAFSDLFLASGGVINWNNGNATLTHSAGLLTSNVSLSLGTSNSLTTGTIELGAASDTTLSRSAAGQLAVEGVDVLTVSNTKTVTNKTFTSPILTTPTINGATLITGDLKLDAIPDTDDTWTGNSTNSFNAGATIAQFETVYLDASGTWQLTDADAVGTAGSVMVALAGEAGTSTNPLRVILNNSYVRNDAWTWTVGGKIYLSTTAGGLTQTAPSGTDDVIRVVGTAMSADVIHWNVSEDWITHV